MATGKEGYT